MSDHWWSQVGDRGVCLVLGVLGGGSLGSCQKMGRARGRTGQEERTARSEAQRPVWEGEAIAWVEALSSWEGEIRDWLE